MSTLVTVVRYNDEAHPFLTPCEETIAQLLDGAVDHYHAPVLPRGHYALVADGDPAAKAIAEEVQLGNPSLRTILRDRDLRLVEVHDNDATQ